MSRVTEPKHSFGSPQGVDQDHYFCADCPPGVSIVGRSRGIERTLEMIRLVAQSRCNPILICGETGTGKELVALAVHGWRCGDPNAPGAKPFVPVNCATLSANLLESELFGHTRGAFTGADVDKVGLFEIAGEGTIFLDEISEMPPQLQAKLLRALQEKKFRKVGGTRDIVCKATIIASSNLDLLAEVGAGRFRRDLYYRLAVFPIHLPTLKSPERRSDIAMLAQYFIETSAVGAGGRVAGIEAAALQRLAEHDWPGNVRELRNTIDRALILESTDRITLASVLIDMPGGTAPAPTAVAAPATTEKTPSSDFSLKAAERQLIIRALGETGWHRTRAASLLGITRATLHAKLKRYEIEMPSLPSPADTEPGGYDVPAAAIDHHEAVVASA